MHSKHIGKHAASTEGVKEGRSLSAASTEDTNSSMDTENILLLR